MLAALASRCTSDLGSAHARTLTFATTHAQALAWAGEGAEALALLRAGTPLPAASLRDPTPALEDISKGLLLGAPALREMVALLEAGRTLRRFLGPRASASPLLAAVCATDSDLDAVAATIAACFEPDGRLSDGASPELRELRSEQRGLLARIHTKLAHFMASNEQSVHERFVTERDGRWVVPVKSSALTSLRGTVHGESRTGFSVFFQPQVIEVHAEKLRIVQQELEREEYAIYTRLSALLCGHADSVEACARAVTRADLRAATAKLARDLRLEFPQTVAAPRIDLSDARHPLLVLDYGDAVASDLALCDGTCLVISGPNAGGKTVTLKTLGIAALMARAGLPIACDKRSTVGMFDVVLTELGDEQSLAKNLSTFSAHMSNMASIHARTAHGALVLLDELASGTDPREGEALASGLLVALCERRGVVAVTTHYEGLKLLAINDPIRFSNASVGFDFATMRPTFRLHVGVPGGSSAFAVAQRFGIPDDVLELSRAFLSAETVRFEQVVRSMNEERAMLERASEDARKRGEAFAAAQRELEAQEAVRQAEAAHSAGVATTPGGESPLPATPLLVREGARVFVPTVKRNGEILDILDDKNVRVLVGKLKLVVAIRELRAAKE